MIRYFWMVAMVCLALPFLHGTAAGQDSTAQEPPLSEDAYEEIIAGLSGDTISLNAEGIEISSLLQLMSAARKVNIVAGPEVTGAVSVNLYDVGFDEALTSILGVSGFTHFTKGGIIYVTTEAQKANLPSAAHDLVVKTYTISHAEPEVLLAMATEFVSESGKAVLGSNRTLVVEDAPEYIAKIDKLVSSADTAPEPTRIFEINHAEPQDVEKAVLEFLSPAGKAMLTPARRIVVQDTPEYMEAIAAMIDGLDMPPRQVLISAKILSVARNDDLSLGVEFRSSTIPYENTPYGRESDGPNGGSGNATKGSFPPDFDGWLHDVTNLSTGGSGVISAIIRDHEQLFVDALSAKTNVETLASPQLLTVDSETARIQVGDRLGFRITTTTETSSLESVEFLDVGTLLEVTPSIGTDGLITLEVNPKVSTGAINSDGLPEERTTEANTVMIVHSGETVMIGGLLNLTKQHTRKQVPVLGDVPVLGNLFKRNDWLDSNKELIILITPYLVGPEATPDMQDDIATVNEFEHSLTERRSDFRKIFDLKPMPRRDDESRDGDQAVVEAPSNDKAAENGSSHAPRSGVKRTNRRLK